MGTLYTTDKLVELVRERLDDKSEPYLVSDDMLAEIIDDVQHEYCEATLCLTDSDTYTITLIAGTSLYQLDSRIAKVRRGYLTSGLRRVDAVTRKGIEDVYYTVDYGAQNQYAWRTATGEPRYMVTDYDDGYVRVVPIPTAVDTIELEVYLRPAPITDVGDTLTLADDKARDLIPGVLAQCYGMQDSEIYDAKQEQMWLAKWERKLGRRTGQIERNTRGAGNVRFNRNGVW